MGTFGKISAFLINRDAPESGDNTARTITITLTESWEQMPYVGTVPEQRMGPSYRWTPTLTPTYRKALTFVLNRNVRGVRVSGGTDDTITLHASGHLTGQDLNEVRRLIANAESQDLAVSDGVYVA